MGRENQWGAQGEKEGGTQSLVFHGNAADRVEKKERNCTHMFTHRCLTNRVVKLGFPRDVFIRYAGGKREPQRLPLNPNRKRDSTFRKNEIQIHTLCKSFTQEKW